MPRLLLIYTAGREGTSLAFGKKGQSRHWELCEAGAEPTPIPLEGGPAWMGARGKMSWERLGF